MSSRRYFLSAVVTAIVAIVLHATALHQIGRGLSIRARAMTLDATGRQAAGIEAGRHSTLGRIAGAAGFVMAVASLVLVIFSVRRNEPAMRAVVYGLLGVYVLLQFVLV